MVYFHPDEYRALAMGALDSRVSGNIRIRAIALCEANPRFPRAVDSSPRRPRAPAEAGPAAAREGR